MWRTRLYIEWQIRSRYTRKGQRFSNSLSSQLCSDSFSVYIYTHTHTHVYICVCYSETYTYIHMHNNLYMLRLNEDIYGLPIQIIQYASVLFGSSCMQRK